MTGQYIPFFIDTGNFPNIITSEKLGEMYLKHGQPKGMDALSVYIKHHEQFAIKDKELTHIGERIAEYNTMIVKKLDEFETKMGGREKWVTG